MNENSKILHLQIEAVQVATYCNIIKNILVKYRNLSIIKIAVFSFIIKKQECLQVECYNAKNTNDLVLKALSQIAGRYEELCDQLPFIFQALDLLMKNGVCDKHQNEIMCKLPINTKVMLQKGFVFSAIEESKTYTDRQFLKEVISIV